ncbi:MAG TPA: hypothetical protein VFI89_04875 [Burkholderiales bacterium]|nr:hypothetical protein [Burkholderiales bacterium]
MQLEISGPKLKLALESLVARSEEQGGVEVYVEALKIKSAMFRAALDGELSLKEFREICAHMSTVRRRIGQYAQPHWFEEMKGRVGALFSSHDTSTTDSRLLQFCAAFPDDREHRWVRDLAAELLHYADPERYPLMTRWVWDARTNTGVLREIWHGDDVDSISIDVPDGYATFLVLRQELSEYLTTNGVFRDVLFYADVLMAQVYAGYIGERGGTYLRADFATPEDPMLHTRRILGLEGVNQDGRSRLKALDGHAQIVQ